MAVPTLATCGGASREWIREATRVAAEAVPGGEHRTLPDQTHEVDAEVPAPAPVEFLGRVRSG